MPAASVHSTSGSIATFARKIGQHGRPDMAIIIDNHTDDKIYSTFDAISGRVEITAPHNARYDEIQIRLEGAVKTSVDSFSQTANRAWVTAQHIFLKLFMPIRESDYPQPRIAEAGKTYTFPFNFVVPKELLPRACSHPREADHVHQAHLQLPPSMGKRAVSIFDDLAPEMCVVQYAVKVKVVRSRERDGKPITLVEGEKNLHIVPAVAEAPPMNVEGMDEDYTMSKTKSLKKGMFSGKLGKVTASASQPSALILPPPSSSSRTPPTITATVDLRFDPHDAASQPPRLGGLTTKIKVSTFYAARPATGFPTHSSMYAHFEPVRGVYSTVVPLSSRCVESVVWTKHDAEPASLRRKSDSSTSSSDGSDTALTPEKKENMPHYTAKVLVPVTLPSSKTWVPSFHACIASRTYILNLSLSMHTPGTGVPASAISLSLPVQIAAMGDTTELPPMTAAEAAAELAEAYEYLRPRVIETPQEHLIGNSVLTRAPPPELPPSYEDFASPEQPGQVIDPAKC